MTPAMPELWHVAVAVACYLVSMKPWRRWLATPTRALPPLDLGGPGPDQQLAAMRKLCDEAADNLTRQIREAAPVPGEVEWKGFLPDGSRVNATVQVTIDFAEGKRVR